MAPPNPLSSIPVGARIPEKTKSKQKTSTDDMYGKNMALGKIKNFFYQQDTKCIAYIK